MLRDMLSLTESRCVIGGYSTRVLERAHDADTTLLFIHGWADSADTFRPLMDELADLPARFVAVDLPHFGGADDLAPGPQLPQYVNFANAALRTYADRGRLLPIGQSLGGRALLMGLNAPGAPKLDHCMVIGPAPLEPPTWQKMLVRNASVATSASKLGGPVDRETQLQELLKSFKRTCFANCDQVPESVWRDYLSHYTDLRIARHMDSLRSLAAEFQQPLDLSSLQCEVDIVWGDLDRMAPVAGAERYQLALTRSRLTIFAGCGHHAHLERVKETAALIRSLLSPLA